MPITVDPSHLPYRQAAKFLNDYITEHGIKPPSIGIICGSGLSGLSETMSNTHTVSYGSVPGFPDHCTVPGHKGEMVFGDISSVSSLCFRGRFHSYEGHDGPTVALPVRILRCIGVKFVLTTNAAGGLNPSYGVGDVISIMDYVALPMLAGRNPLVGLNDDELGPRFPSTSDAFDPEIQGLVVESANSLGFEFVKKDGVYCFVSGPMYESKAECRFLKSLGGDAVGMSTIPEVVAAHHSGMKIACLSLITNKVIISGDEGPAATHEEVLEAVDKRAIQIQSLVTEFVSRSKAYIDSLPTLSPITLDAVAKE